MSTVASINFKHPSSASNNLVLDSGGNATFAGTAAMASSFLRNRIINGDMRIDQRNAGASVTLGANGTYTVDRWYFWSSVASRMSAQRSTVAPAGFTNSMLVTSLAATSPAAGDNYIFAQVIEGFNIADFGFGAAGAATITISFWVRSSVTGTYACRVSNGGTGGAPNRSYVTTFAISAANTWEYKTVTIPGDTSGTWQTGNSGGLEFSVDLGSGSSFNTTANAWQAGNFTRTSGATTWVGTNGATFQITGVQLEVGSVATPFERRQYGQELALCQRYYEKSYNPTITPGTISFDYGPVYVGTVPRQTYAFKVSKRAAATVTLYRPDQTNVTGQTTGGLNIAVTESANEGFAANAGGGAVTGDYRFNWVASSEL